jgi:hypothetical protein
MFEILSSVRRRNDAVELTMVALYVVLTVYLFVSSCPPQIVFALRDAVAPFQIRTRARQTGTERSAAVWRQFENRRPVVSLNSRPGLHT